MAEYSVLSPIQPCMSHRSLPSRFRKGALEELEMLKFKIQNTDVYLFFGFNSTCCICKHLMFFFILPWYCRTFQNFCHDLFHLFQLAPGIPINSELWNVSVFGTLGRLGARTLLWHALPRPFLCLIFSPKIRWHKCSKSEVQLISARRIDITDNYTIPNWTSSFPFSHIKKNKPPNRNNPVDANGTTNQTTTAMESIRLKHPTGNNKMLPCFMLVATMF